MGHPDIVANLIAVYQHLRAFAKRSFRYHRRSGGNLGLYTVAELLHVNSEDGDVVYESDNLVAGTLLDLNRALVQLPLQKHWASMTSLIPSLSPSVRPATQ